MAGESYSDANSYLAALTERSVLPEGFTCGTVSIDFKAPELGSDRSFPLDISALLLDEPSSSFGATLTRNRFPGAPVQLARRRLSLPNTRGVLINNKVANVYAPGGIDAAGRLLQCLGQLVGAEEEQLFCASTGVIGWGLPVEEMITALPSLNEKLSSGSAAGVARAIMTTDAYPKLRSASVGRGRIVGLAKGAGMIEPNMATLLVFILTDLAVDRDLLRHQLTRAVNLSFNRISIDGDQSTSDMVLAFSSGKVPATSMDEFEGALVKVCMELAEDVVRNGEGTSHVLRLLVREAMSEETALGVGKAVINSPLVKTAIYGNDPNIGRIIMAIGDFLGNADHSIDTDRVEIQIGGQEVFANGAFRLGGEKEKEIAAYLRSVALDPDGKSFPPHDLTVDIVIGLGQGDESAEVLGSDLTYEYVRENAEYRT